MKAQPSLISDDAVHPPFLGSQRGNAIATGRARARPLPADLDTLQHGRQHAKCRCLSPLSGKGLGGKLAMFEHRKTIADRISFRRTDEVFVWSPWRRKHFHPRLRPAGVIVAVGSHNYRGCFFFFPGRVHARAVSRFPSLL